MEESRIRNRRRRRRSIPPGPRSDHDIINRSRTLLRAF